MKLLEIKNLHAAITGETSRDILRGLDLTIQQGEVHAIMGPNGSGKSTLAHVLAGREGYTVTDGEVTFFNEKNKNKNKNENLLLLEPEERAAAGLFLAFQYPVEIPGVNNMHFLRTALNSQRKSRGEAPLDAMDFIALAKEKCAIAGMDEKFLQRAVNEGFSGGEKKRNELLQMLLLAPTLAILDETDSGLDVDALQKVAAGVNSLRDKQRSFLVITHYQRLLDYIIPDIVHIMINGRIVKTGDANLAREVESRGYAWLDETAV